MDDKDYIGEKEGDEDMSSTVDSVKDVTKDRKKNRKCMIGEIEVKVITLLG